MKSLIYILFSLIVLSFVSCSGTRGLSAEEKLFIGTEVSYENIDDIIGRRVFTQNIERNFLKANTPGILNIKTGLYNVFKSTGKRGFKHMVKYKMGSEPVVFNSSMLTITEKRLTKTMEEDGYLQGEVKCDSIHKKKRQVLISCKARTGPRYIIDSVFYAQDTLPINNILKQMYTIEYTKPGEYYQLKNLISDRDQFITTANNNGYPFVNPKDVVYFVDTLVGNNRVNVHMRLRPTEDSLKYERYTYGGIFINPNFSIDTDNPTDKSQMQKLDDFSMVSGYDFLNEKQLKKAIFIYEGKVFNKSKNKITTDRLLDFGLFKFVNVKTIINPDKSLDHFINLTTYPLQSLTGELELFNRQGNIFGTSGQTVYTHKNIFGGAERFDISLSGGLETQFGDNQPFINTSDIKLEGSLTMPFVRLPFKSFRTNRNFIPKTYASLSFNQENRINFYRVRALKAKYGFRWNETKYKESFFTPIDFSWVVLSETSADFENTLALNPRQAESFRTTLLLGSSYEYLYNKRDKFNPANQTYFKGKIESAGNLLSLFVKSNTPNTPATIANTPYSQYVRLTADFRKYWGLDFGSLATRFIAGTGFAFGNSNELPYSKQYAIGGANSLRAFRLRRLGPGEFTTTQTSNGQFLDQTGDVKLEANVEYRFPIIGYFKGAAFIDAGNVWLREVDPNSPNGEFRFDTFAKQIAVGAGIGLRFDIEVALFRLDIAFPIRKLRSDNKFGWVIDEVNIFDSTWRSDNIVLNLGIGYPF